MTGDGYPLSEEIIVEDAIEILLALDATRDEVQAYQENWRRLWQLVREAKAASLAVQAPDGGPWHYRRDGVGGRDEGFAMLMAGDFALRVWPPDEPRSPTELPELLNWAGVLPPRQRDGQAAGAGMTENA